MSKGTTNRIAKYYDDRTVPHSMCKIVDIVEVHGLYSQYEEWYSATPSAAADKLKEQLRLQELESQMEEVQEAIVQLRKKLESLESGSNTALFGHNQPDPSFKEVMAFTKELFPGTVEIDNEYDPSDPETAIITLSVNSEGTPTELLQKEKEWNRKLREAKPGNSGKLRLILYPHDDR